MAQILVMAEMLSQLCVVVVFREPYWDELLHSGMYFADKSISERWTMAHLLSGNRLCSYNNTNQLDKSCHIRQKDTNKSQGYDPRCFSCL